MSLRACSKCGELFDAAGLNRGGRPRSRCETCRSPLDTARWKKLRALVLAGGPLCQVCGRVQADTVDHILPTALRPDLAFELSNLRPCCRSCNSKKKAKISNFGDEHPKPAAPTGMPGGIDPCRCPPACRCWVRPDHPRHWCL